MQGASHQKHRLREEVNVKVEEILSVSVPQGSITEEGVRVNISVALQYMNSWLLVMSWYEHAHLYYNILSMADCLQPAYYLPVTYHSNFSSFLWSGLVWWPFLRQCWLSFFIKTTNYYSNIVTNRTVVTCCQIRKFVNWQNHAAKRKYLHKWISCILKINSRVANFHHIRFMAAVNKSTERALPFALKRVISYQSLFVIFPFSLIGCWGCSFKQLDGRCSHSWNFTSSTMAVATSQCEAWRWSSIHVWAVQDNTQSRAW